MIFARTEVEKSVKNKYFLSKWHEKNENQAKQKQLVCWVALVSLICILLLVNSVELDFVDTEPIAFFFIFFRQNPNRSVSNQYLRPSGALKNYEIRYFTYIFLRAIKLAIF